MEYYNQFSHLLSSVCSKSIVHFIQSCFLTHYQIVKVVLYVPLRLIPTSALQRVGDSLREATVFRQPVTNRLVVSLNRLAY